MADKAEVTREDEKIMAEMQPMVTQGAMQQQTNAIKAAFAQHDKAFGVQNENFKKVQESINGLSLKIKEANAEIRELKGIIKVMGERLTFYGERITGVENKNGSS